MFGTSASPPWLRSSQRHLPRPRTDRPGNPRQIGAARSRVSRSSIRACGQPRRTSAITLKSQPMAPIKSSSLAITTSRTSSSMRRAFRSTATHPRSLSIDQLLNPKRCRHVSTPRPRRNGVEKRQRARTAGTITVSTAVLVERPGPGRSPFQSMARPPRLQDGCCMSTQPLHLLRCSSASLPWDSFPRSPCCAAER